MIFWVGFTSNYFKISIENQKWLIIESTHRSLNYWPSDYSIQIRLATLNSAQSHNFQTSSSRQLATKSAQPRNNLSTFSLNHLQLKFICSMHRVYLPKFKKHSKLKLFPYQQKIYKMLQTDLKSDSIFSNTEICRLI